MPSDPIQHLRELLAHRGLDKLPWKPSGASWAVDTVDGMNRVATCDSSVNAALIVAAINALPALLAVAEAARHHEIVRQRCSPFDEYEASRKVLQDALAKLYDVKPS